MTTSLGYLGYFDVFELKTSAYIYLFYRVSLSFVWLLGFRLTYRWDMGTCHHIRFWGVTTIGTSGGSQAGVGRKASITREPTVLDQVGQPPSSSTPT